MTLFGSSNTCLLVERFVFRMLNGSPQHFPWRKTISGRSFLEMLPGFGGPLDAEARPHGTIWYLKPWDPWEAMGKANQNPMDILWISDRILLSAIRSLIRRGNLGSPFFGRFGHSKKQPADF